MGPRHVGRGNVGDEPELPLTERPSMGPRHVGRGNAPEALARAAEARNLQWGRDT